MICLAGTGHSQRSWQHSAEEDTSGRQAGTNNTNVNFDQGPLGSGKVVVLNLVSSGAWISRYAMTNGKVI